MKPKQKMIPHLSTLPEEYTEEQLDKMANIPIGPPTRSKSYDLAHRQARLPMQQIIDFVFAEGAIAIASPDGRES